MLAGADGDRRVSAENVEAMKSARINMEFNGDAGPRQTGGVGDVLINEEVERRAGDEGGRQAAEVSGSRGGSVGRHIWAARLVAQERGPAEAIVVRRPDEFAGDWVGLSRNAVRSSSIG